MYGLTRPIGMLELLIKTERADAQDHIYRCDMVNLLQRMGPKEILEGSTHRLEDVYLLYGHVNLGAGQESEILFEWRNPAWELTHISIHGTHTNKSYHRSSWLHGSEPLCLEYHYDKKGMIL